MSILNFMALTDDGKTFRIGELVLVEKSTYGLLETVFTEKSKYNTTILFEDNVFIQKHSVGMVVGFITDWVVPAAIVSFSDVKNGQNIVITYNKINSLEEFTKRLDS